MNDIPDIPDELVQQVLADPKGREAIEQLLKANNIPQSIDELPPEMKKAAVAALLNAQQQAIPPAPDEVLDQVLADTNALEQINAMLKAKTAEAAAATAEACDMLATLQALTLA